METFSFSDRPYDINNKKNGFKDLKHMLKKNPKRNGPFFLHLQIASIYICNFYGGFLKLRLY